MSKKNISMEDAKKKATGFLGYLKHLVKDPVKTVPEAKQRWKEVLRFLMISLIITVAPIIIMMILKFLPNEVMQIVIKIVTVPVIVGVVGTIFSAILCLLLAKVTAVLKLRECTNCKEQITYGDNIKYNVLREWEKKEVTTKNGTTHVRQTEMAEVEFQCTCQKCGTSKQFKQEFRLANYYDGSLRYSYKLDELVEGFFTGAHIQ